AGAASGHRATNLNGPASGYMGTPAGGHPACDMAATASAPAAPPADPGALRTLLDGEHAEIRNLCRAWLSEPANAPRPDLPLEEHRAQVLAWAKELADAGQTARGFPVQYGGQGQVGGAVAGFETLAFGDLSLMVKCGVQFGLFGGAVLHLGTAGHHERYLYRVAKLEL